MEHRIGSRIELGARIELWSGGVKTGDFTARDISHGGLFIEGANDTLNAGNLVEIRMARGAMGNPKPFSLRAFVVRQCPLGTGLMWAGRDLEFHNELNRLRSQQLCANG